MTYGVNVTSTECEEKGSLLSSYRKILSLHHDYSALAQCSNALCNMKMDLI